MFLELGFCGACGIWGFTGFKSGKLSAVISLILFLSSPLSPLLQGPLHKCIQLRSCPITQGCSTLSFWVRFLFVFHFVYVLLPYLHSSLTFFSPLRFPTAVNCFQYIFHLSTVAFSSRGSSGSFSLSSVSLVKCSLSSSFFNMWNTVTMFEYPGSLMPCHFRASFNGLIDLLITGCLSFLCVT